MNEPPAPRLRFTMTPTWPNGEPARLTIVNLDPLDLKAGESKVFMLVEVPDPDLLAERPN